MNPIHYQWQCNSLRSHLQKYIAWSSYRLMFHIYAFRWSEFARDYNADHRFILFSAVLFKHYTLTVCKVVLLAAHPSVPVLNWRHKCARNMKYIFTSMYRPCNFCHTSRENSKSKFWTVCTYEHHGCGVVIFFSFFFFKCQIKKKSFLISQLHEVMLLTNVTFIAWFCFAEQNDKQRTFDFHLTVVN